VGKLREIREPVFFPYIFIQLDETQYYRYAPINSTWGIDRILTKRDNKAEYHFFATISDTFITALQRACRETEIRNQRLWLLSPGTRVRLLRGPFANQEGIVLSVSSERVRIMLYLLNRTDVKVEVSITDVLAIEAPPVV
jgi:transcription antitermination factor NusG